MKISKAIFATDDNPKYSGLWEVVSEICKKKLDITPVLFHITEEDSDFYEDEYGLVKKFKKLPNHSTGYQSQIIRMWGTKYFSEEVCIICDIDMIMFNKEYFIDQVSDFSDDDLVIYCSDAYDSKRPECVGIYSDRYSIAYNATKGKNFDKILGTNCSFQEYADKLSSFGFPTHDTDEMYYTRCLDTLDHGVNLIKLERGIYTKFQVPRRIDRISDDIFNKYEDEKIYNEYYVDCHLARPFEKYRNEILDLKNKILKKKEVYLIGCHIENNKQLSFLNSLVNTLIENGKDYILSSHTMIPQNLIEKSVGFIYDRENPKYKIWDLKEKTKYELDMGGFIIKSPYIMYGRVDYYHVGPLRQLINGVNFINTLNYDIVHWMDYDSFIDFDENEKNVNRLEHTDLVFYGIGPKFSFRPEKFRKSLFTMNSNELLDVLSKNEYVVEKVFGDFIIDGDKTFIEVNDPIYWGLYSQNFDEIKFDWSLFELNGSVNIFIKNDNDKEIEFLLKINNEESIINILPGHWLWKPILSVSDIGDININWRYKNSNIENTLIDLNLLENYNIVSCVEFVTK